MLQILRFFIFDWRGPDNGIPIEKIELCSSYELTLIKIYSPKVLSGGFPGIKKLKNNHQKRFS